MAKLARVTSVTIYPRADVGTTGAKRARAEGKIPGALYGHGGTQAISVDLKALADLIATGGASHVVDATIDGKHESVLLREVQRNPITHRPISADFQRVSQTEAITASIAIVTTGVPVGVKDEGGVMDVVTHALDVKGPAGKLPEQFEVDVNKLAVGDHVSAGDIKLPSGFTLITPSDTVIVAVEASKTAADDAAITAAAPVQEPVAAVTPAAE